MGGWEARRSDRDMCENRRAEQSATTKMCATQVSNYTDLTPPLPFYAVRAV